MVIKTKEILFPDKFSFLATDSSRKVVCEPLSKRVLRTVFELDNFTLRMGFSAAPILVPFTMVELAMAATVLPLVWFQLALETQSAVFTQIKALLLDPQGQPWSSSEVHSRFV